jgi:hypothetical protein
VHTLADLCFTQVITLSCTSGCFFAGSLFNALTRIHNQKKKKKAKTGTPKKKPKSLLSRLKDALFGGQKVATPKSSQPSTEADAATTDKEKVE